MKKFMKVITMGLFLSMLLLVTSCKLSTNELAEEVKISMLETWEKDGITGVTIESLILTHKADNEYSGILITIEDGEKMTYTVKVIYDGENMQWEVVV